MINQTIEKLAEMRLHAMIQALKEQEGNAKYKELAFEERLAFLVDKEYLKRKNSSIQTRIKTAKLPLHATVEDLDFSPQRTLKKGEILSLAQCSWVANKNNLIITGPTGAGKTHLACALAGKACRDGFKAFYIKCLDLVSQLMIARADGSFPRCIEKLNSFHLLIIDEWMRDPMSQNQARELLDLIDSRYNRVSTIFLAQLPVEDWHKNFEDPTLADATLDRIVHNSHRIEIKGPSMREKIGKNLKKDIVAGAPM